MIDVYMIVMITFLMNVYIYILVSIMNGYAYIFDCDDNIFDRCIYVY